MSFESNIVKGIVQVGQYILWNGEVQYVEDFDGSFYFMEDSDDPILHGTVVQIIKDTDEYKGIAESLSSPCVYVYVVGTVTSGELTNIEGVFTTEEEAREFVKELEAKQNVSEWYPIDKVKLNSHEGFKGAEDITTKEG